MVSARALAALDELPEATVVLLPVRDEAGSVVDLVFDYANHGAAALARMPADTFAGRTAFTGRYRVAVSRLGDGLLIVYEDLGALARARAAEQRYGAVLEA